jgi:hypothetical protein
MMLGPSVRSRTYIALLGAAVVITIFAVLPVLARGDGQRGYEYRPAIGGRGVGSAKSAELWLKGSHNYRMTVRISQHGAQLIVQKGHTAAIYTTHDARLRHSSVFARFGRFGRLKMRFIRRGWSHKRVETLACGSRRWVSGVFRGQARFHGEHNFSVASAKSALGRIDNNEPEDCKVTTRQPRLESSDSRSRQEIIVFSLGERGHTRFTGGQGALSELRSWEASTDVRLGSRAIAQSVVPFSAIRSLRVGGIEIVRLIASSGARKALSVGENGEATVRPPAPFQGVGHLAACRLSSWAGNLTARFPGEDVDLTSSKYWALVYPGAKNSC